MAMMSSTVSRAHPSIKEVNAAKSLHVFTFSSQDELLLVESEGRFSMDEWDNLADKARVICLGDADSMVDVDEKAESLEAGLRSAVEEKARLDGRWKNG